MRFSLYFLLWIMALAVCSGSGLGARPVKKSPTVRKVVVTGAGSSVGYEVFKKLLKRKTFSPVAVVRDKSAYNDLIRIGATPDQVKIADITKRDSLRGVFNGASKVVLCTSAQPQVRLRYRVKNFFRSIIGKARSPRPKDLKYERGQEPYNVDFLGQKNVIDLAVRERVEHIVMVGNMGGYRGSKLNDIGRSSSSSSSSYGVNDGSINSNNSGKEEDPKKGNILKWKRAAERYLMKRCFFTILHAGALTDDPPGQRDVVFDNDDALLRTNFKTIPCKDLAEVVVQSLVWKEAIGRSLDVAAREKGTGSSKTQDWLRFWSTPGNNLYPADDL